MAKRFESFLPCCQSILELLERERRTGARNCEKGHLVSIDYARQIEAMNAAKRAKAEAERKE